MPEEKEEKTDEMSLNIFIRGAFPEALEKKLLQNWKVLPLRVFDECRKRGVQFIDTHKKGISVGQIVRTPFIARRGGLTLTLRLGEFFGSTIEPGQTAQVVSFETDDVVTSIALGEDGFEFDDKKPKIAFIVESTDFTKLDQIAEYKEKLVADLAIIFSVVQQVLDQKEVEIWIDVVSMILRLPKDSKFKKGLDIVPLANWAQNVLEIPTKGAESLALDRFNFDWKKDGVQYSAAVSKRSIQLEVGELNIKGDTISVAEKLISIISNQYTIVQNMRQTAMEC